MKKMIFSALLIAGLALTGCSTATEAAAPDIKPVSKVETVEVKTDKEAEWAAPVLEEVPPVVTEEAQAWEAWDASGVAETLDEGGRVEYVQPSSDGYLFEVTAPAPVAAAPVAEVVTSVPVTAPVTHAPAPAVVKPVPAAPAPVFSAPAAPTQTAPVIVTAEPSPKLPIINNGQVSKCLMLKYGESKTPSCADYPN